MPAVEHTTLAAGTPSYSRKQNQELPGILPRPDTLPIAPQQSEHEPLWGRFCETSTLVSSRKAPFKPDPWSAPSHTHIS